MTQRLRRKARIRLPLEDDVRNLTLPLRAKGVTHPPLEGEGRIAKQCGVG